MPRGGEPVLWLLAHLFLVVGLPFFALASLSPLLQRWFAATRHESARDPYFLYAASNAGSFVALVGYPLAVEPLLALRRQSFVWSCVYAALALLVVLCAAVAWRATSGRGATAVDEIDANENAADAARGARRRGRARRLLKTGRTRAATAAREGLTGEV